MVGQLREKLATTKEIKNDFTEIMIFKQFRKHLLQVEKILMKKRVSGEKKKSSSHKNGQCVCDMQGYLVGTNGKRG